MAATCLVDRIPTADEIKRRIADTYRETRLLKSLLRVAEQREKLVAHTPTRLSAKPQCNGRQR